MATKQPASMVLETLREMRAMNKFRNNSAWGARGQTSMQTAATINSIYGKFGKGKSMYDANQLDAALQRGSITLQEDAAKEIRRYGSILTDANDLTASGTPRRIMTVDHAGYVWKLVFVRGDFIIGERVE